MSARAAEASTERACPDAALWKGTARAPTSGNSGHMGGYPDLPPGARRRCAATQTGRSPVRPLRRSCSACSHGEIASKSSA
eukprot:9456293-Lingulodinium_polyedra.AAC.1